MTNPGDRQVLLGVARTAIVEAIAGRPARPSSVEPPIVRSGAAFVSLHVDGALRGCIGHLDPAAPLVQTIAECARAAGTEDPRFPPVTAAELDQLDIEISVLGAFERVNAIAEIEIGRHGLLVERDGRRGLLLPQVATDHGWTVEVFVEQTCHKAGLSPDSWQHGAILWRFDAEVFGSR
jgi:AmmeMemoRadiSam system protein A